MSVVDRERFLQCVAKCGILSATAHEKWSATINEDTDSKDLARDLVRKKLVTRWQAKMLLKGANRLSMGNYLLTDRIGKTDFGDRFAAVHRQLSRDVTIQYLPIDVCASASAKKKIFEFGSKLAELDHPNLVHVYDIDEERDRIYLVSESARGVELSEARKSSMSSKAVANVIAGCLRGLEYAHSKEVVHGEISDQTIVVGDCGESKIRGLTRFAVRNSLADSPATAAEDLEAVAAIAESLLKSLSDEERKNDAFAALSSAIEMIKHDERGALAELGKWIGEHETVQAATEDLQLAPATARAEPTAHPAMAVADGKAAQVASPEPVAFVEESSDGFLTGLARKNPMAIISAAVLSSIVLIGGTVFAASKIVASPNEAEFSQIADLDAGETVAATTSKKKRRKKKSPPVKVDRPDFRETKGSLSESVAAKVPASSVTDPDANKAAIAALFNKTPPPEVPVEKIEVVKVESNPVPAESNATPVPAAKEQKDTAKETVKGVEKSPQKELKAGEDPFKDFARMVDLPAIENTEEFSFGKLILEKNHLLGAEILSTSTIHRSKPIFTLGRSADDRQTWDISYKKKKKSDPVVIAKLRKTPDELFFNWLPSAAEISVANYLRNCRVKISTAVHSHWITLRKPVKIEGFKLGANKGAVKMDFEIPWLPNPAALQAKANGIKFERQNKDDYKEKAYMEPAEITPNQPSRMFFHDKANRFLSLDVAVEVRKKLTVQAALVLQPIPDQPAVVLKDPAMMPQAAAQVRLMAQQAEQQNQQAQASKMKADEKKVYKDAAKAMMDRAELTGYYEFVVPQLVDKDIPVSITYALNEQHRILLAYTVESEETKEKK
jgi:hypothetical protein